MLCSINDNIDPNKNQPISTLCIYYGMNLCITKQKQNNNKRKIIQQKWQCWFKVCVLRYVYSCVFPSGEREKRQWGESYIEKIESIDVVRKIFLFFLVGSEWEHLFMIYIQVEFQKTSITKQKKQVDKLQPTSPDKRNPEKHTLNIICNKTNTDSICIHGVCFPFLHQKFIEIYLI